MGLEIVFLNRSFYPEISATSQLLTELCESLVEVYRYRVTVICGRPLNQKENSLTFRNSKLKK